MTNTTAPNELVSGVLASPRFEIDSLHPVLNGVSVRVQLRSEQDAMNLIRATTHPEWVGPRHDVPEIADDDAFCDEVESAVREWVATFPLLKVNAQYPEDCWDAFANRPFARCCSHPSGGWGVNNAFGNGLPRTVWYCRTCGKSFAEAQS